ncbi:MAG: hypothetical protein Q4F00_13395 [bacterium]|nr:hypothetical protein [bacterium]
MSMNLNRQRLYIVSRESVVEARRLIDVDEDALVLLVGRGLFLPVQLFDKRKVYAISEEVKEQGLEGKLSAKVECLPANEVIDLILDNTVLNFS